MAIKVSEIDGRMTAVEDALARIVGLLESKQDETVQPPVVESAPDVSLEAVKAFAKSQGVEIRGKVTAERESEWRKMYAKGIKLTVVQGTKPDAVKDAESVLDLYAVKPSRAERDEVRISSANAAEALSTHPMADKVVLVTREGWAQIRSMGAEVKKNGQGTGQFKPNPGNLNGADRKNAHFLYLKPGTSAKPWTLYQGCLILAKLDAAGLI